MFFLLDGQASRKIYSREKGGRNSGQSPWMNYLLGGGRNLYGDRT